MLEKIGRYRVTRLIGEGTAGAIFEAHDPLLMRPVAIKVMRRSRFGHTEAEVLSARFQREARVAALLNHPNIVPVYDAGNDGDLMYLVLQFARGEALHQLLERGAGPDPRQSLRYALDLLDALAHAHRNGVLHLDVRPAYLLIDGPQCRLTEFGVAHIQGDPPRDSGVPANRYSAPELIRSEAIDERADVFSAGVILHEMLTGEHPFVASNTFLTLQRITSENATPVSRSSPSLPTGLDAIVGKAMARDPRSRYATAQHMREDLEAVLRSWPGDSATKHPSADASIPTTMPTQAGVVTAKQPIAPEAQRAVALSVELGPGVMVEEFRVLRTLAAGGFGIVYLVDDTSLGRQVALKEFFPRAFSRRLQDGMVEAVPPNQALFAAARDSFYREAQTLAGVEHPAVARVYRTFRGNGTAYIAMPYYQGETLKAYVQRSGSEVDDAWLRNVLLQVGDALSALHARQTCHRDVAPDNIMLTGAGPVLLDFGAARQVLADSDNTLTVILKHGFAPPEQYGSGARQGPWTDVYALAAVGYFCVTGRRPQPSVDRLMQEDLEIGPASQRFSREVLQTIELGLRLDPARRPRSVEEWLQGLRH